MRKKVFAACLALALVALGAKNTFAIEGGQLSCTNLKTILSKTSTETGSAVIVMTEDCSADLVVKSGQKITLDAAGHTLSGSLTVETGGELILDSFSTPGIIKSEIKNSGDVIIKGGSFTSDPTDYLADCYLTKKENNLYIVVDKSETEKKNELDFSKITSNNEELKNALIDTLNAYINNPDDSTSNGRKLNQLVNALKLGHTLTVSLVLTDVSELPEGAVTPLMSAVEGLNLASIYDVKFTVSDNADLSVELSELATPVTVTIPIPEMFKAALRTRGLRVINLHTTDGATYTANIISDASLNANGDLTFRTTTFSVDALSYDGDAITANSDDPAVPSTSAYQAPADNSDVTAPDTAGFGTDLTVFHLLMLSGISLVVIAIIAYAAKRAYIRNRISLK
ncbi:hypothetical protein IKG73_02440 [Candidatus Saccharibacteria bacterium]|nr:hypothetical protein [Candidatus Saccharibacteria bacterium]